MHEDAQLFPDAEINIGWTRDEYNLFFPLMQDFGRRDREIIFRMHSPMSLARTLMLHSVFTRTRFAHRPRLQLSVRDTSPQT